MFERNYIPTILTYLRAKYKHCIDTKSVRLITAFVLDGQLG